MRAIPEKTFDCVEFKRTAQLRIDRQTMGMTLQQRGEYIERQAQHGSLGAWWRKAKAAGPVRRPRRPKTGSLS